MAAVGITFERELGRVQEAERRRRDLVGACSEAEEAALDRLTLSCCDVTGPGLSRCDQAAGVLRLLRDSGVFDSHGRRR